MNDQSSASDQPERFNYVYSSDLKEFVSIKICSLEGKKPRRSFKEILDDPNLKYEESEERREVDSHLYVTVRLYAGGKTISLPVQTQYKHYVSTPNRTLHSWNEWLKLPLRYSDLPRDALAVITIWDSHGPCDEKPVGGTTIPLFGKYGTFRKNRRDLVVWPDVSGDGAAVSSTPFKLPPHLANPEITKLAKLVKNHREGPMATVDWLDRLAFTEIEATNVREKSKQDYMYLSVEFSRLHYKNTPFAIVYFENHGEVPTSVHPKQPAKEAEAAIIQVSDYELSEPNLIEEKHHKLVRSVRHSTPDLKPNAAARDQLTIIINSSISKQTTSDQDDLIWKFRYYLMKQKEALVPFLRIVKWDRIQETAIALQLLDEWTPIDVADALQLLSPNFDNTKVRQYAVKILDKSTDAELELYLLQLVQALKYEDFKEIEKERSSMRPSRNPSEDMSSQSMSDSTDNSQSAAARRKEPESLANFLIRRACENMKLSNYFFWYVFVETQGGEPNSKGVKKENPIAQMYNSVLKLFSHRLNYRSKQSILRRKLLIQQHKFVDRLSALIQSIQRDKGDRKKKIDKLKAHLASTSSTDLQALGTVDDNSAVDNFTFTDFQPIPLPLDPDVEVCGIIAENATLFKSNLMPARLPFRTVTEGLTYTVMFKEGDDLRQDQLVLQIIQLMDNLLQEENLDLKLTPYRVLATSSKSGFVQIVESVSIAEVLAQDGSIQNFMRKHHPSTSDEYGIDREVMETYVKSCAGYCVITYILGVGDRHLDNLMLIKNGALFHVDFGYILGRDPKPLPPPMKLSREMVDAMGGIEGHHYPEFRKYCFTAFLQLRRHANLILNLFSLMTDADVPDIALEPDKTVKKVQDKFLLELSDEEAVRQMQILIDESVRALFTVVVDQIHKIAQNWRK